MARHQRVDILVVWGDPRYAELLKRAQVTREGYRYLTEDAVVGWVRDDGWVCAGFAKRCDALRFGAPKVPPTVEQMQAMSYV